MRVVVAPDSFKGTLTAPQAAEAIADGWRAARPDDQLVLTPLSDGGDGLLDVLAGAADDGAETRGLEVAGPVGEPVDARWLLTADGTAVVESARACGLARVPDGRRNPLHTTTFGVGQLIEAARRAGAERVLVGMGGSATVDGGTGALTALGFRLTVPDGSGLRVGAADLRRVAAAGRDWVADWDAVTVEVLCDVRTTLLAAPRTFGPQKGADAATVRVLEDGLLSWAEVAERDLTDRRVRTEPGSGAAGGLAFGLAAGLDAPLVDGAAAVAEQVGLEQALEAAEVVITGEGRLDPTSAAGKVVGQVLGQARQVGVPVGAVAGAAPDPPDGLAVVVEAAPDGPGEDPRGQITAAAERLAAGWDA